MLGKQEKVLLKKRLNEFLQKTRGTMASGELNLGCDGGIVTVKTYMASEDIYVRYTDNEDGRVHDMVMIGGESKNSFAIDIILKCVE